MCYNNFYQTLLCCVQKKMCVNVFAGSSSDCVVTAVYIVGLVGGLAGGVGGWLLNDINS